MSRRALRRAVGLSVLLIALSLALGYVRFGGTLALWTGETSNPSSPLEAGWVGPATGLGTPTPSGYGASLTWTPGTHGPVTGQEVYAASGGTGASASCGTYALDSTMASATTASYTTSGSSANNGAWRCYEMVSTSATAWTATAAFTPIRVGLYPTTVAISNGGTSNTLDSGDTITITFNQNVSSISGSSSICAVPSTGSLLIGDSNAPCAASDTYTIGKLTGLTVSGSGPQSVAITTSSSTTTVTVTVGTVATPPTVSGSPVTFTASTSVTSSVGSAAACTSTSAPDCTVTASGGF